MTPEQTTFLELVVLGMRVPVVCDGVELRCSVLLLQLEIKLWKRNTLGWKFRRDNPKVN